MGGDLVDLVDEVVVGEKYVAGLVLAEEVVVLEEKDGENDGEGKDTAVSIDVIGA